MQAVNQVNPELGSMIHLELVDIAESETLINEYGTRIPVLEAKCGDSAANVKDRGSVGILNWPFNHQDYADLVNKAIRSANNVH